MNLTGTKTNRVGMPFKVGKARITSGLVFAVIVWVALAAFEIFNYSTTEYALRDVLGELRFAGVRWATILTIAFCGIDFAGIARLFAPVEGNEEPKEVWYLFGAWLLAATMNAMLTWWGVSMAIVNHSVQSAAVVSAGTLTRVAPVFVAVMVWVIRILIIGSLSMAGERMAVGQSRRAVVGTGVSIGAGNGGLRSSGYPAEGARAAAGPLNASAAGSARGGLTLRPANHSGGVEALRNRGEPSYHSLGGENGLSANNPDSSPRKF